MLELVIAALLLQNGQALDMLVHQAQEALQSGRFSEAREKLQRALKHAPRSPALWTYLGLADSQLNDIDAAIADFQKALSLAPRDAQTHFNLGLSYRRKGDSQRALQMYERGLKLAPDDPPANQNYALLLMENSKFREAIAPLQRLRTLSTSDISVRVALVECYLKGGMQNEGAREIQDFLHSSPTAGDQLKLAKVLVEDEQPEAAQWVLEHVVKVAPDSAEAHAQLGRLLAGQNKFEEATREMGRAVQLSPESAEYSMRLAEVLILWKRYPTALEFLTAVKERFGGLLEYRYKLGLAYYGLPRIPQAVAVFEDLARDYPNLDLVQFFLGNCYQTTGDYPKAEPHYKRAIELNPQQASYYAALAQLLRKQSKDRTEEAIVYLEKALALDPRDTQSKLELAFCREKKLDYSGAQGLLEEVVAREPDLLQAHVALARVYYRQKKRREGDLQRSIITRLEAEQQSQKSQTEKVSELSTP